ERLDRQAGELTTCWRDQFATSSYDCQRVVQRFGERHRVKLAGVDLARFGRGTRDRVPQPRRDHVERRRQVLHFDERAELSADEFGPPSELAPGRVPL